MTDDSKPQPRSGQFHAVRFYENDDALCRIVAEFLAEGFSQTLPAVIIATPDHTQLIDRQLHARGFDVVRLKETGDLVLLDAGATLAQFMRDGMPDQPLFTAAMTPIIEVASRRHPSGVIRMYGEMVDLLWRAGRTVAAVRLEMLWNELARTAQFALLCGYSMGNFYKDASVEEICRQHTHVISATGERGIVQ